MRIVYINSAAIESLPTLHDEFNRAMGFPTFYGRNMDAWIDCMSAVDDPEAGMSDVTVAPGEILVLEIPESLDLAYRCPDLYKDIIECTTLVNQGRAERGHPAVLALLLR